MACFAPVGSSIIRAADFERPLGAVKGDVRLDAGIGKSVHSKSKFQCLA